MVFIMKLPQSKQQKKKTRSGGHMLINTEKLITGEELTYLSILLAQE